MQSGTSAPGLRTKRAAARSCPPETSEALKALEAAVAGTQPVIFETRSEEEILRGQALAKQFKLNAWYRGSGEEYRIVDVLRGQQGATLHSAQLPGRA